MDSSMEANFGKVRLRRPRDIRGVRGASLRPLPLVADFSCNPRTSGGVSSLYSRTHLALARTPYVGYGHLIGSTLRYGSRMDVFVGAGEGSETFSVALMCAALTGATWLGRSVAPARVLYVTADPAHTTSRLLGAVRRQLRWMGLGPESLLYPAESMVIRPDMRPDQIIGRARKHVRHCAMFFDLIIADHLEALGLDCGSAVAEGLSVVAAGTGSALATFCHVDYVSRAAKGASEDAEAVVTLTQADPSEGDPCWLALRSYDLHQCHFPPLVAHAWHVRVSSRTSTGEAYVLTHGLRTDAKGGE